MHFVEPHIHMVSRTTDDYESMARWGCVAVSEPSFWAGFDRGAAQNFRDYFRQLTQFEPQRAARYGIQHYCWLCINSKEAENADLAREVISIIPEFLDAPNVLGLGEIGLNKNTRNEAAIFLEQVDLAMRREQLMLVHTPHLEDKHAGTRMILDMLADDSRIDPDRVLIDHLEEHTVRAVRDRGFWAGLTLYPITKCTPQRAADILEIYGPDRIMVNSAADWGPSRPSSVPDLIREMRRRGHGEALIRQVVHDNPLRFFRQNRKFAFQSPGESIDAATGRVRGPQSKP